MKSDVLQVINSSFSVAGQLDAGDMADVAQAGYKSVIINRPDFEENARQPVAADVMQAAHDAGLAIVYQPVISGELTQADAEYFARLLRELPKPVLAYCRSGARCRQLYKLALKLKSSDPISDGE